MFITAFTTVCHISTILRPANPIHVSSTHVFKTIILKYYPPIYTWVFQVVFLPSGFGTEILCTHFFYPTGVTLPAHFILLISSPA
jgi:hypothetical protein